LQKRWWSWFASKHGTKRSTRFTTTTSSAWKRTALSEVGVYTVKNGKIVREEFLPRAD